MKEKRVLVIGAGRLGAALVEELWDTGVEIVVIDKDEAAIEALKDKTSAAFVGDGSDPRVLEETGAREMDVAIVTSGEDFEAAVLAVSALAHLRVPSILARAANARQGAVFRAVGATRVVLVEQEMGRRLAPEVLSPASSELAEYASSFRVVPWAAKGAAVGKSVAEFNRRFAEINVLGCWREPASGTLRKRRPILPGPDYRIESGDTLLLIGVHDAIEEFLAAGRD